MKKALVLAVITMVLPVVVRGQTMTCEQVDSFLAPCFGFLTGGPSPSPACCTGVKILKASSPNQNDRRVVCQCLKETASRYADIKPNKASQLPKECGVEIGVPITKDVDCSKIS